MGRVTTPKYRAELRTNTPCGLTDMAWNCRTMGTPTVENAEAYRVRLNESFQPGGVNGPRKDDDVVIHVNRVRIVNQFTDRVVAETNAPMFEVV